MNENENKYPFSDGEESAEEVKNADAFLQQERESAEQTEESVIAEAEQETQEELPVVSVEEADGQAEVSDTQEAAEEPADETAEEETLCEETDKEDIAEDVIPAQTEDTSVAEEVQTEEPVAAEEAQPEYTQSFNPYAPKKPADNANNGTQSGVNPSYGQPLNSRSSVPQGGYYQGNNYNYNPRPNGYYNPGDKKSDKGRKTAVAVVAVCLIVAVIALVSSFLGKNDNPDVSDTTTVQSAIPTETTVPTTTVPAEVTTTAPAQQVQNTTTATVTQPVTEGVVNSIWVAEKVRPSVVGVLAYQQGELAGEGSGVLMCETEDKNGTYIVTCAHVINEPQCEFSILLLDGSSYEAEVVALDERTDIGVLRVEATGLPLAEFGDSDSLKVGEPIYAIGNPGGSEYFGSITNGIVASIDRSISATYTMTCIQHNAAINPGNSGGALVNTAGQVIGINSSKIAKTDYEGMGFAVPSSIFASVVDSLIKYGYVPNRPELGIKYAAVNDYQLYSIIVSIKGLPKGSIIIADIPEGSALSGTEAEVGDLIVAVNGKDMDSSDVLLDLIDTGAVGDTLTLTLCRINDRNYETSTFDVTVTLVENKGSVTTTTQAQTLPRQDNYGDFEDFFGGFFGW